MENTDMLEKTTLRTWPELWDTPAPAMLVVEDTHNLVKRLLFNVNQRFAGQIIEKSQQILFTLFRLNLILFEDGVTKV